MSLRLIRATDPIVVERIVTCLYAVPGIGKTSTGYTAEKPILLDFDHGSHRSKNRRDTSIVEKWEDVMDIKPADLSEFSTVVVDTAGRALDCLTTKIIADDPKMGRGGALTLQGYGRLKSDFISWTKMIRFFGKDVVLLCHSDESKSGDDIIERLDVQGGSKNEIYKSSDVMGRLYINRGKRWLNFSPTDTSFGKNPASLPALEVPDYAKEPDFLAKVIADVKAKLNELSVEQTVAMATQIDWKTKCEACVDAGALTAMIEPAKALDVSVRDNCKRILVKVAMGKGFILEAGKFHQDPTLAPTSKDIA